MTVTNISCDGYTSIIWEEELPSGWVVVSNAITYTTSKNGNFRYTIDHPMCGEIISDVFVVDCISSSANFLCDPLNPLAETYYIDATIPGFENVSAWLAPNTVPTNYTAIPNSDLGSNIFQLEDLTVIIKGDLIIDVSIWNQTCEYVFEPAASLSVETEFDRGLRFLDCELLACEGRWNGITVTDGRWLVVGENSRIRDAQNAVTMNSNSNIYITETNFEDNIISLFSPFDQGPTSFNVFSNNTFLGNPESTYAIRIESSDFNYASIVQSRFRNYSNASAISLGAGNCEIENVEIDRCRKGIHVESGISFKGRDIVMDGCDEHGIFIESSPLIFVDLENMEFSDFFGRLASHDACIAFLNSNDAFLTLNDFTVDDLSWTAFYADSPFSAAIIKDINLSQLFTGFKLLNSDQIRIDGGTIVNPFWAGIESNDTDNLSIENVTFDISGAEIIEGNNISLRDNNFTNMDQDPLRIISSSNLFICGNDFQNAPSDDAVIIDDPTVTTNYYLNNDHINTYEAPFITASDFGRQPQDDNDPLAGNTWDDNSGAFLSTALSIANNVFTINPNEGIDRRPAFSNLSNADFLVWFPEDQTRFSNDNNCNESDPYNSMTDPTSDCCLSGECLDCGVIWPTGCEHLLDLYAQLHSHSATINNAQRSIIQQSITRTLEEYPDLADCFTEPDTLAGGEGSSVEGLAYNAYKRTAYEQIEDLNAGLSAQLSLLRKSNDWLRSQKALVNSTDESAQAIVAGYNSQLNANLVAMQDLVNTAQSSQQLQAESLLNELAAYESENIEIAYLNKILEIETFLLTYDLVDLPMDYRNDLIQMAHLCPYEYGRAVYLSRIYLNRLGGPAVTAYNDAHCGDALQERQKPADKTITEGLMVFPNPTTGIVNLSFTGFNSIDRIDIYNSQGAVVWNTDKIDSYDFSIDLSNITSGAYVLTAVTDRGLFNKKIVLIK